MENQSSQLISYIDPASPTTRKPSVANEPFTYLEIGFSPKSYQHSLNINFNKKWHTDQASPRGTIISIHEELRAVSLIQKLVVLMNQTNHLIY